MKSLLLITFILLVQQILGHGWVYSPPPRGFTLDGEISASQQGPCGLLTPTYPTTFEVEINGTMLVSFRMGTDHDSLQNPGTCTFALSTQDVNNNPFDNNVIETITPCNGGDHSSNISIIVPRPGTYYVQWKWTTGRDGGNWYNCIRIFVDDPNINIKNVNPGVTITEYVGKDNVSNFFYNIKGLPSADPNVIETQNLKHLLLDASVSPNSLYYANFTYSTAYLPLDYTSVPVNDNNKLDSITPKIISVCNFMTKNENDVFVAIFPYQNGTYGNFTGEITFTSTLYDAKIDFIANPDGVRVSLKKGSIAYFWTGASTTQTSSKRIVVQSDNGGDYYINGPYRVCNSNQYVRGENHCGDLGQDINYPEKQYWALEILNNDFTGKIKVEKGKCEDYSGVSGLLVSIVLLLAVLLF